MLPRAHTRPRRRALTISAAAVTAMFALPLAAHAANSDDQARADAGIAAFGEAVTAAGYVDSGESNDDNDPLDLAVDEGATTDPTSADAQAAACAGDVYTVVNSDGSFVGQTARAISNTFDYVDSNAPATTELFSFGDNDSLYAAVYVVDEAHRDGLATVIDTFGSQETIDCLNEVFQAEMTAASSGDTGSEFLLANEDDLGIGDQSAEVTTSHQLRLRGRDDRAALGACPGPRRSDARRDVRRLERRRAGVHGARRARRRRGHDVAPGRLCQETRRHASIFLTHNPYPVAMKIDFVSEKASIASMPRSRPRPLWRIPPNGIAVRTELFELIESVPERIAEATRSALAPSRVQIDPDNP